MRIFVIVKFWVIYIYNKNAYEDKNCRNARKLRLLVAGNNNLIVEVNILLSEANNNGFCEF